MDKKISIIIPVHHAENYLSECLESIVNQDYRNFEIILVDDKTSGNSEAIYHKVKKECDKIHVLEGEPSGPATERNKGLQYATGEYLMFVDADDYLPDSHVLSRMVQKLQQTDGDIVVGNYQRLWNGKLLSAASHKTFSELPVESEDFRFQGFFSVGTLSYVWGKMYRASFLKEKNLQFAPYTYAEDKMFSFRCYINDAHYEFIEENVYVYRKNDTSVSYTYRPDSVRNWISIAKATKEAFDEAGTCYDDLVAYTIFFGAFFDGKMNYEFKDRKIGAVKEVLKEYAKYPISKEQFKRLSRLKNSCNISSFMWRFMIRGFAIGMRFHLYTLLGLGIKLLVDCKIDERLSDTGKRE